ncbi:TPM domain-containing protein [Janthinobacterium sp. 17J80-10]|uniref:TPM domain-containing protein n=1 Tax=Janthinobacterium sp. 17J80-10 TaxID=2497863 RepID=UPI001005838B|nr:TPM domain-containing protein [Janthinobacterium sp. 17J80-10]QAU33674.1 YgcG family protein [Janthinobacterium sp. 17J80-10]
MTQLRHLAALLLLCLAQAAWAQGFVPVPALTAHVTDSAGMLTPAQRQSLESVLQEYETRTGSQIAIVLVSKTEPEAIEQYGIRVADAWKIGRKGVDDGVILLVAKDNPSSLRRLRIEAGRGVQGVLTDAQSKRILQDVIAPHFRQNDFYGGLAAGVSAITSLLAQEKFPAPQARPGESATAGDDGIGWMPLLFFAFMVFVMMSRARSARRRFSRNGWGEAAGVILGSHIGRGGFGGGLGGGGGGFGGGDGFSGGGGGFDGGGASGDW